MTKGGSAWFRPTVCHALHTPKSKMVATVCCFPDLKAEMIRGLPHPVLTPAPTRTAQKRDDYIPPAGEHADKRMVTDRGPHQGKTAKGGSGETPEGKRLAPDIGHRVDTDQAA